MPSIRSDGWNRQHLQIEIVEQQHEDLMSGLEYFANLDRTYISRDNHLHRRRTADEGRITKLAIAIVAPAPDFIDRG